MGICLLGSKRPKVCKEFPARISDIITCGKSINKQSTCVASIGGGGCNMCGQCCKDRPWSTLGSPETNFEIWIDEKGACIFYKE
jgi:Fe-S-cluster containining protein